MNQQKMNIITNSVFVDSSIVIEYIKGNKTELLTFLLGRNDVQLVASEIVLSEIAFHFLSFKSGKSPLSVKSSKKISEYLPDAILTNLISALHLIGIENVEKFQYLNFMSAYNLCRAMP